MISRKKTMIPRKRSRRARAPTTAPITVCIEVELEVEAEVGGKNDEFSLIRIYRKIEFLDNRVNSIPGLSIREVRIKEY